MHTLAQLMEHLNAHMGTHKEVTYIKLQNKTNEYLKQNS